MGVDIDATLLYALRVYYCSLSCVYLNNRKKGDSILWPDKFHVAECISTMSPATSDISPFHDPQLAWQKPQNLAQSVNEVCEGLCGGGDAPSTQEVGCVIVWRGVVKWHWWHFVVVVVAVWFLWHPVVGQYFIKNGRCWRTRWCCCGCVLAPFFQPSFCILNAHLYF